MPSKIDLRHLHAITVLAEELNVTRAAHRLHLTQSALSKQIIEIEAECRIQLFKREKKRLAELTDAGRVFVEEAQSAILHADRAFHRARATYQSVAPMLMIGHTVCVDSAWISALLSIRLLLFPRLRVRLASQFATELVRSVLAGELNLALVTAPPRDAQITCVSFAESCLFAAVPHDHPVAEQEHVRLKELANDEWIVFAKRVHPTIYNAVIEAARSEGIAPKDPHEIIAPQQGIDLVAERVGVALLPKPTVLNCHPVNVLIKPVVDKALRFEVALIMRRDDDSRVANEFARAFLRKQAAKRASCNQLQLPLSA